MTPEQWWAAVGGVCAVVQVVAAVLSLQAAWKSEASQRERAEKAEAATRDEKAARLTAIHDTAKGLGERALAACGRFLGVVQGADDDGGFQGPIINWDREMSEASSALAAIRPTAPPDVDLVIVLARLQHALNAEPPAMRRFVMNRGARHFVSLHQGSLTLALADLERWRHPVDPAAMVEALASVPMDPKPTTASL